MAMTGNPIPRIDLPSPEYLLECFDYRDGRLYWRKRPESHFHEAPKRLIDVWNGRFAGKPAGGLQDDGYLTVVVNRRRYRSHRLIYHMMVAPLTIDDDIDHRDRNPLNNKYENLRKCSICENFMNQPARKRIKGGPMLPKHIWWSDKYQRYKVVMRAYGKRHYIGTYRDLAVAVHAAKTARNRLHGEFAFESA